MTNLLDFFCFVFFSNHLFMSTVLIQLICIAPFTRKLSLGALQSQKSRA